MKDNVNDHPVYCNSYVLPEYAGNPLIEALRPQPETKEEATKRLLLLPRFDISERGLSKMERTGCIGRLSNYMFPMGKHIKIFQSIYDQIFDGLVSRNPLSFNRNRNQYGNEKTLQNSPSLRSGSFFRPAKLGLIVGPSGMGKSALAHAIMRGMGPNILRHREYRNMPFSETQITYLLTNVPGNCSARKLCGQFVTEVDSILQSNFYSENYCGKYITKDEYLKQFQAIIAELHVGILFVDEFQNLSISKSGGKEDLIAFLVNIRDKLSIPTIFIGTNKVAQLLTGEMAIVRRLLEGGIHHIEPFESARQSSWTSFCEATWQYQWVRNPIPFSQVICDKLFECSAGIPALMINLFQKSQKLGIENGAETVRIETLDEVYNNELRDSHELVEGIKSKDEKILNNYEDYYFDIKPTNKNEKEAATAVQSIVKAFEKAKNGGTEKTAVSEFTNAKLRTFLSSTRIGSPKHE